ncbi:MAG: vancomycin high temperature exclusion protein [Verrucomicrobia bacterium]|nr:MAG: vancomycin high temperature exclusion protein [Verrucomicrobiota bacterium]
MNKQTSTLLGWLRKHRGKFALLFLALVILPVAAIFWADHVCRSAAAGRIFHSVNETPQNDVALVLGTGKLTPRGRPNLHFNQRINAAVELYQSGKVHHLLVSGDNHIKGYDEPTDMRDALIAAGVPTNAITCDYAGFRTLDSVVRAQTVFGLKNFTIVTEEFHCPRSVWIARQRGLNAVAFAAPDLTSRRWTVRVKVREALARVLCGLDLYLLHTQPKFPGPSEPLVLTASAN